MKRTLVHLGLALATTTLIVQAAPGGKQEQVRFAAGKTSKTVSTTIEGKKYVDFLVTAKAGQRLSVSQKPVSKAYFNVNPPGTEQALFNGSVAGSELKNRQLPNDGTYAVRVYLMGGDADSQVRVPVNLNISVTGQPLPALPDKLDAKVGSTPYHATGLVPCKYYLDPTLTTCEAGVIRRGRDGTATVALKMKGFTRCILFVKGRPVASDSAEEMKSARKDDLTTVTFGNNSEVYQIRDVFVSGD